MDYQMVTIRSGEYDEGGDLIGWYAAICDRCGAIIDDELRDVHDGWHYRVG